ncbi:hypothetical protein B481_2619 [Planococcus halocryophilus Or1]|uniref:hypothetical protein n=1 Tax=Planococcus halocryophilus TaxID=1215089 RepID=UPI0002B853A2|nr:hypothetical protein [Planococcus halocryophilus]EMF46042.1 hypothetical protein B481_2619 [Planococcus halocryophilus Or1]
MTVLFASDLDQTLIYSRNSMGMDVTEEELVEVERYEGKPLSFMTKKVNWLYGILTIQPFFFR